MNSKCRPGWLSDSPMPYRPMPGLTELLKKKGSRVKAEEKKPARAQDDRPDPYDYLW